MMDTKRIVTTGVLALAAFVVAAADLQAQEVSSFAELPRVLEPGQRVIVREDDGRVSRGKVVLLDGDRLEIRWRRWLFAHGERSLTSATVESIKVQDSDWNGTLLGAGVGILVGALTIDRHCDGDFCIRPAGAYMGAWIGAGIGGAIDRSINRLVYAPADGRHLTFAPVAGAHSIGFIARAAF